MSENTIVIMEVSFNIRYLITVWTLVYLMFKRQPQVTDNLKPITKGFLWAFSLLALGDTGHVGFRVWAYALGDLSAKVSIFGQQFGLVGAGALSTAITITFFYVIMLFIWHKRFEKPYGWFGWLLFIAAGARLVIMLLPGNQWNNVFPPKGMSLYRNLPLMIQGIGVAYLILRDAFNQKDKLFAWIGVCIIVSYALYIPVIMWVQQVPMIGMLMIPKTIMYLVIAWLAYTRLFIKR